ncbi:hypothetical protein B0J17DRAFT_627958 [Rhizoctonia solani]|nr:hypothetical protein B0J17DRAFT_627958 [Rhizoctonia solani]
MKRKIEFNTAHSQPQLEGPIITWYNQLQNTKVASLEYHQNHPPGARSPSKIIVSLTDGSKYLLQRRVKHASGALVPHCIDTIQNISPLIITTQPLIRINFDKNYPDLLFVLIICYGAQNHGHKEQIARFFIDDDFFALAIILNVARTQPSSSVPSKPLHSSPAPLECLWKVVYCSLQSQEHTFWGHAIADETKNIMRELIYRAARLNIAKRLPQDSEEDKVSVAASIVARVESIIKKRELNESTIWDNAWNKCWDTVWRSFHSDVGDWRTPFQGIWPAGIILQGAQNPTVEGRAPGSIAGRTPERHLMSVNGATWLHSVLVGHHPSLVEVTEYNPKDKLQGSQACEEDPHGPFGAFFEAMYAGLWSTITGVSHPTCKQNLSTSLAASTKPSSNSRGACACSPKDGTIPNSDHSHEIWASPREMAVHLAWEAAWPEAVLRGRTIALEAQRNSQQLEEAESHGISEEHTGFKYRMSRAFETIISTFNRTNGVSSQNDNYPQVNAPLPQANPSPTQLLLISRRRSSAGAQTLRQRLLGPEVQHREEVERRLQDLVKERTYREKKEMVRLKAKKELSSENNPPSEIKMRNTPSQEQLKARAWQTMIAKSGQSISDDATITTWKERFKTTWEQAWKESWVKAWQAVWDDAWDAAVARGTEFGVEEVFDKDPNLRRANYENLVTTEAYRDVQALINRGDHLSCLEQVRSMMKELYHLYESLQHTIPVSRDETLKITGFDSSSAPKAKKYRPRRYRYVDERKPKHLSYYELQLWVEKHYINKKFEKNENGKKFFKRRIAQVWGTALAIHQASNQDSPLAGNRANDNSAPIAAQTTA